MYPSSWFVILATHLFFILSGSQSKKVVCYYQERNRGRNPQYQLEVQDIDPTPCTHILVSSPIIHIEFGDLLLGPVQSHTPSEVQGKAEQYWKLRTKNAEVSLLLSVTEKSEDSGYFPKLLSNKDERSWLINYLCTYTRNIKFDGLDINWQWPGHWTRGNPDDKDHMAVFIKELRTYITEEAKKSNRTALLLSVVLPPLKNFASEAFHIGVIANHVDMLQLMSMDYSWSTDPFVNHHAPLHSLSSTDSDDMNVASTVEYYLEMGVDKEKLNLGIPLYGISFTLDSVYSNRIGSLAEDEGKQGFGTNTTGTLAYFEVCSYTTYSGWKEERPDSTAMGPYAYKGLDWVAYDDPHIISKKVEFALNKGLGGVMLWSLDLDDFKGHCLGSYPLTKAARHALQNYDKTSPSQSTTLAYEDEPGYCEVMELILHGVNINDKDRNGRTRAMIAAAKGDLKSLRCLVEIGADLSLIDNFGDDIVRIAAKQNRAKVLRYLVKQRVDFDLADNENMTALFLTAKEGYLESFQILLEAGADLDRLNRGMSLIDSAAREGHMQILLELYKHDKTILGKKSSIGLAPLYYVFDICHLDTVKELVSMGAEVTQSMLKSMMKCECSPWTLNMVSIFVSLGEDGHDQPQTQAIREDLLRAAAYYNCIDIAKYLLDNGARIEIEGITTPLHEAAANATVPMIDLLLTRGANINAEDPWGGTPLHGAVRRQNRDNDFNSKDKDSASVAHQETYSADESVILFLLNRGAHADTQNKFNMTPLLTAAYNNNTQAVKILLDRGVQINVKDEGGFTALHWATELTNTAIIELLLNKGAEIEAKDNEGKTALYLAASSYHFTIPVVQLLLDKGADINSKADDGSTMLHEAVNLETIPMVEFLLNRGVQVNVKNSKGSTALHEAVIQSNMTIIKLLLNKGAEVEAKNNLGETVLYSAVHSHYTKIDVIQLLLDKGANTESKANDGNAMLHMAVFMSRTPVIELLLNKGAQVDVKDSRGHTPLHWAAFQNKRFIVELLLDKGADINSKDIRGHTPLDYVDPNFTDTHQLLIKRGAQTS